MSSVKEENKESDSTLKPTMQASNGSRLTNSGKFTGQVEKQSSAASLKTPAQKQELKGNQTSSVKNTAGKESQSGSKSTLISKQFSASSNKQSDLGRPSLDGCSVSQTEKKDQLLAAAVRRTTRESKPSSRLVASIEGIQQQAIQKQGSTASRKESTASTGQTGRVLACKKTSTNIIGPPKLSKTLPSSADSPSSQPNNPSTAKSAAGACALEVVCKPKSLPVQPDLVVPDELAAVQKNTIVFRQVQVPTTSNDENVSKKSKRAKDEEQEEIVDLTVSEDNEDDDDSDDDDDEDDDDEIDDEESVATAKPGAPAKKSRAKRNKKKQTSRKLWSRLEDEAIVELVKEYGTKKWTFVANKLEEKFKIRTRTGKQCRERWHNHLDPYINKTPINKEEEKKIFDLHKKLGNKWADIAKDLPGRSDNCIKNYFYSTHRKHQRRINKSLRNSQIAKSLGLGLAKNLTAEELHKLVIQKKATYEQIRKLDPAKFIDLESTMRMLYDHGNMKFDSSSGGQHSLDNVNVINAVNASMREPKRTSTSKPSQNDKIAGVKRKTRPDSLTVKPPAQASKPTKRAKISEGNQTKKPKVAVRKAVANPDASYSREEQQNSKMNESTNQMGDEIKSHDGTQDQGAYQQNQQNTPVFYEKPDMLMDQLVQSDIMKDLIKKRQKKAKLKEDGEKQKQNDQAHQPTKDSPQQASQHGLNMTRQESSGKEKGFHKIPYTNQQPSHLQLGMQQSGMGSYKNLNLGHLTRGFLPQPMHGGMHPLNSMGGFMPRGFPMHGFHTLHGMHHSNIDPACHAKYELAWGADYDRINKGQPSFKAGELPPATPDTSMMFKDGFMNRQIRNPMVFQNDKMFNLSMNSPMFIPIMNEVSPRPPTTRYHPQNSQTQPNAVNFTLNVNVNSNDYRMPSNQVPTPSQLKSCPQCNMTQCQCNDMANLDTNALSAMFHIDGQKSAMQRQNLQSYHQQNYNSNLMNQPSSAGLNLFRPQQQQNREQNIMSQTSVQDESINAFGQAKMQGSMMSDMKSEIMPGSSHELRNKNGYLLSALNSEMKSSNNPHQQDSVQKQSFMKKLSQACPLVKDVSFGGPQSFGTISGLPSSSTVKNKQDNSVFPATAQSQIAFSTIMGRSVTPRPLNAVTPAVTVTAHNIQTPKCVAPAIMHGNIGQDMPSTNHEADVISYRSQSQPSAFKPVQKKRAEALDSKKEKIYQPVLGGVTKSNEKQDVTESQPQPDKTAHNGVENAILSQSSNNLSPEDKRDIQRQINESNGAKNSQSGPSPSQ